MDVVEFQIGIDLADQSAIGGAFFIERDIRHLLETRLQRGEAFHRRLRTREFFLVERERTVFFMDGHKTLLEMPALDRSVGTLLADKREFIGGLA